MTLAVKVALNPTTANPNVTLILPLTLAVLLSLLCSYFFALHPLLSSHCSSVVWYRTCTVRSPVRPIFFPRMSHCDRIYSSFTADHCFDDGYVRKQPVALKEYCAESPSSGLHSPPLFFCSSFFSSASSSH